MQSAGDEEEAVVEGEAEVAATNKISSRVQAPLLPDTGERNIRIFRQESGKDAPCIINMGVKVIFVQSHPPALGKMCSSADPKNETGTSPLTTSYFMTLNTSIV